MEMLSRDEAERRIKERAASDPDFRKELLANPRQALESELGMPVPEQVAVNVHQESLSEIHIVLPATEALSDADLEMVAGGGEWYEWDDDNTAI